MTRRSDAGRGALEDLQLARGQPPAAAATPQDELAAVLERVRRLRYDHNNPERFHAERSDIAGALGGLLGRLRGADAPAVAPPRGARERCGRSPERRLPPPFRSAGAPAGARPILHLKAPR